MSSMCFSDDWLAVLSGTTTVLFWRVADLAKAVDGASLAETYAEPDQIDLGLSHPPRTRRPPTVVALW